MDERLNAALKRLKDEQEEAATAVTDSGVTLDDFFAYMLTQGYIYWPTREMWPASRVNARVPAVECGGVTIAPSVWLAQHKPVEQMTWFPGEPMLIKDRLTDGGSFITRPGVTVFNMYRPPFIQHGDKDQAGPWVDHVRRVFTDDAEHIICWLAHRVQRPHEKINHALVLGGSQGIGKDTLLEPAKRAVGPWNFVEVSPQQMLGRFNGYLKSVILRISEARDLGDSDRFAFYEHLKAYTAAPPDVLRIDEKNLKEYGIPNVCGVVLTTNHKTAGIHLPADDRRHFVAWSDLSKDSFEPGYWNKLWHWYDHGGDRHVAAYLASLDLSNFNPKAPPPKTPAFWAIVDAGQAPEDSEMQDAIDALGNPDALTLDRIVARASDVFGAYLLDRKNSRLIPHRLEACGYVAVRNSTNGDGRWQLNGRKQTIYAKATLSLRERVVAATAVANGTQF